MKGLALNKRFFFQIVKPLIEKKFINLKYSCGLIGPGSDVLGLDDLTSRDHNWGLRLILFLEEKDIELKTEIVEFLSTNLPKTFENFDVNWSNPAEDGSRIPEPTKGKINHGVRIYSISEYLLDHFGMNTLDALSDEQWLTISEQKLLEFTSGEVFIDSLGKITSLRKKIAYYPEHIKILNLIGEWKAIASEIAFIGRTRMLYDEVGSHLIACRLIHKMMRIVFILENKYVPYAKWLGSKFYYLQLARELLPIFQDIISSTDWEDRENKLIECYLLLAQEMKRIGLISANIVETFYYSRPQKVINVWDIIKDLQSKLNSEFVKKYSWGSINQVIQISDTIDDKDYLENIFQALRS
jgi:hypothetical protein